MSVLEAYHLAKGFGGVQAVQDVSFTVDAGEMVDQRVQRLLPEHLGGEDPPGVGRIERFSEIVFRAGYASPVRTPRGRDILAACGQLKSETERLTKKERDALTA